LKGGNKMGFFAMIGSMLLGIFSIILGICRRKSNRWYMILIPLGIAFVLFAIYLGLPK